MLKYIKRSLFLFYYLKNTEKDVLDRFINYVVRSTGRSRSGIIMDMLKSVYKFNISLKDYFYFRFFELDDSSRMHWAGTGFMYEYQLTMNPRKSRKILEDKIQFLNHYLPFVRRQHLTYEEAGQNRKALIELLNNGSGRLVLKGSLGQVGAEVKVLKSEDYNAESLLLFMKKNGFDLIEQYVVQHPSLMELSPSGLNTVRIFTQFNNGSIDLLGARLRITVNSEVDNMAAGNLAASINLSTGIVDGPGVYSDITKEDALLHPVTGISIQGFQVPFWEETIKLVKDASLFNTDNRSIGWDIAIRQDGPELIEGNHNWCKLLWQLPVKKGLKAELLKYA